MRIVFDLGAREARLGATVVPIAGAGSDGELRVGGPSGAVLRPLAFGERTRVVARALAGAEPREAVAAAVLAAATVRAGAGDRVAHAVVALALAGAGEAGPRFGEAALLVARAAGWSYEQLEDAPAAEVDRLARQLGARAPRSEWNRFVLADEAGGELETIRRELAQGLVERADEAPLDVDERRVPATAPGPRPRRTAGQADGRASRDGGAGAPRGRGALGGAGVREARAAASSGVADPGARAAASSGIGGDGAPAAPAGAQPHRSGGVAAASGAKGRRLVSHQLPKAPPAFSFDGTDAATPARRPRAEVPRGSTSPARAATVDAATAEPHRHESLRHDLVSARAAPASPQPAATAARAAGGVAASAPAPVHAPGLWGAPEPALPPLPPLAQRAGPQRNARAWPASPPPARTSAVEPATPPALALADAADLLAVALDAEADLRGIAP